MTADCVVCGASTPDGWACVTETERARQQLAEIAELTEAARAVMYRQTATGTVHSTPGPRDLLDYGAGARLDAVQFALTGWVRDLDHSGTWTPAEGEVIPQAAAWLTDRLEIIRHVPHVDDILREIWDCLMAMRSVVAAPAGRVYLGVCGAQRAHGGLCCGGVCFEDDFTDECDCWCHRGEPEKCDGDVYGKPDKPSAVCNKCGAYYDQAERRVQVAKLVQGGCYRASQLEHAYGLNAATVRKWAERELIVAREQDGQGRPMYRLDEVLAVAASESERLEQARQKRHQRRGAVAGVTPG